MKAPKAALIVGFITLALLVGVYIGNANSAKTLKELKEQEIREQNERYDQIRKNHLHEISLALEEYYRDCDPSRKGEVLYIEGMPNNLKGCYPSWEAGYQILYSDRSGKPTGYLKELLRDPETQELYMYGTRVDDCYGELKGSFCQSYTLTARLSDGTGYYKSNSHKK